MSHNIPHNLKEFKEPVLKARTVLFETNDMERALSVLDGLMSMESAHRVLQYKTFRYTPMVPEGHPVKTELRAATAAKQKRYYHTKKHKAFVIQRDGGHCKYCGKEVAGRDATMDHIDPDGPSEPDNLQLLCKSCNSRKNNLSEQDAQYRFERARMEAEQQNDVWKLIESAQTCDELETAQDAYMKLDLHLHWLPEEFFFEKAKELPGYEDSPWKWAEDHHASVQNMLAMADELYETEP